MSPPITAERTDSLRAYPNIRAAARILGVDPSTLSRRRDLEVHARGDRDRVVPLREMLRLAGVYRKRSLSEVADLLIEHAVAEAPDEAERVEEEIETYVAELARPDGERTQFLATARRLLPGKLYTEVERVVAEAEGPLPVIVGKTPDDD